MRPRRREVSPSSEVIVERTVRLPDGVALHARPAGSLVRAAAAFASEVYVNANGRRANAKSILDVLALGADGGTELAIEASGEDAVAAAEHLAALVPELA
jgi:phosphocarrier protein HPr